jgi:hypothetical protein
MRDLALAGGGVAIAVTMQGCPNCCNANPDPCCGAPKSPQCAEEKACLADGGVPGYYLADGGTYAYGCEYPGDLGVPDVATPIDLAKARDVGGGD